MIPCPSCKRKVLTRFDVMCATLDGRVQCRVCGRMARLDLMSRWMILCVLALALPTLLLYGGVFYSGHLFVVSMFIIFSLWAVLSSIGFPLLALEPVDSNYRIDRVKSLLVLAVLVLGAIILDAYMASRFEPDDALQDDGRAPSVVHRKAR